MGLIDRLRRRPLVPDDAFSPMPGFRAVFDEITRFVTDTETLALMRAGQAQRTAQEQYYVLDMLAEEGRAEATEDGFAVAAEEISRLDDSDAELLGLPARFTGEVMTSVSGWTARADFRVDLSVRTAHHPTTPERRGPVIIADGVRYRTSVPLLRSLRALDHHAALPPARRNETENVSLVAHLQDALRLAASAEDAAIRDPGFRPSLGALDRFSTVRPESVGLTVEPQTDGSLLVEPNIGPGVDASLLSSRWQQITPHLEHPEPAPGNLDEQGGAVLRADNTLVLLEPKQLAAIREVRARPRIARNDVRQFLEGPGSYYDPELVDVDINFGVRVAGLGVIAPVTFTEASSSGLDWFAAQTSVDGPHVLADAAWTSSEQTTIERDVASAWEREEPVVRVQDRLVDVSDRSMVEEAFAASRERLAQLQVPLDSPTAIPSSAGRQVTVGMHIREAADVAARLRERADGARPRRAVDYESLRREPYPHQRTGIEWMTGLMQAALGGDANDDARIQGALLADDMGLGKTFMALAALAEVRRHQRETRRGELPTLAVMPVALLENWTNEIKDAFGSRCGPFTDVVVLQGPGLAQHRLRGAGRETAASVDDLDAQGMVRQDRIHVSLRVGPAWGDARLDRPGVLVLTTYETLRRYQVSLGLVDWGVVVFDEAQATKNPEILTTRAAKALKARFKLLATGTPVENSLRDFWSLVDTAQPGLLGSWAHFNQTWVQPMEVAAGEDHHRLGRELRDAVGAFMLRRIKEDHLTDLPPKHIKQYPQPMPPVQVQAYDDVLAAHKERRGSLGAALKTLHQLEAVSLHPGLLQGGLPREASALEHSARTLVAVRIVIDDVRSRGEKAIVFAKTKEFQRALRLWLAERYGLAVDVVNGDTAATGTGETRLAKIRAFEAREGFNVIIMSPLAVGVGLTVVGANHAIHLERHWNPAKEAQATDRIHRIGQKREVHVHYPVALHPDVDSFDVNLDRLLQSKVALKDAVVVPQEVARDELERSLGLA